MNHPEVANRARPPVRPQELPPIHHGLLLAFQSIFCLIVVAIFISTFSVQPFRIPSGSMEPTLLVGDFIFVNKQISASPTSLTPLPHNPIARGDIIVFHYPVEPSLELVKRVIALPGDHIRLRNGAVYINGERLSEPYAIYRPSGPDYFRDNFPLSLSAEPSIDSRWWIQMHQLMDHDELTVPKGQYFVLGDNRNNSEDSRYWGFVPHAAVVGKPLLIYFSLRLPDASDFRFPANEEGAGGRNGPHRSLLERIFDLARWDRTLQVIH